MTDEPKKTEVVPTTSAPNGPRNVSTTPSQSIDEQGLGKRISRFLDAIKPYRDLLALLLGMAVAVSAAISWTTAYFATRLPLINSECRMNDKLFNAMRPVRTAIGLLPADWAKREIERLAQEKDSGPKILKLLEDIKKTEATQEQ